MGLALKAKNVWRKYGSEEVLKGFSFELEEGAFEALMGPSGCGKSTFLHLAAGLLSVDEGEIEIGGERISAMGDGAATRFRRRQVGVVFQAFNLLNEKSVRENILLPIRLESGARGVARAVADGRLDALSKQLGLEGKLDKMPEDLSGGERQRVAIARALVVGPKIVLADEPTGNLDAKCAKDICELFKGLSGRSAILIVTHDPVVAACARKVHFLKDGKIAASVLTQGDPSLVSRKYLEMFR